MEKLGKEQDSKFYWDQATQDYVDALAMPYHEHRLKVAFDLIPVDLIKEDKIIYDNVISVMDIGMGAGCAPELLTGGPN